MWLSPWTLQSMLLTLKISAKGSKTPILAMAVPGDHWISLVRAG